MQRKKLFTEIPYIEGERLTIKEITQADAPALQEMVDSEAVYRLEPSFLFEKKYDELVAEGDGFGCDDVLEWATLSAREDSAVDQNWNILESFLWLL